MDTVKSACVLYFGIPCVPVCHERMNVLILAVTILAAVVSYLAAQRSVVWLQNNRAENDHARQCMWYLRGEAWSPVSAKDIRILHMKEWLLKTMKQNYEIFMHFERALGNHHLWQIV